MQIGLKNNLKEIKKIALQKGKIVFTLNSSSTYGLKTELSYILSHGFVYHFDENISNW